MTCYLIRHGLGRHVGRFFAPGDREGSGPVYERGQTVVVRTTRGTELGEVLVEVAASPGPGSEGSSILRLAALVDIEQARRAERERSHRFDLCRQIARKEQLPIELIDVETLLDDRKLVLHYLGPHALGHAAAGLLATLRAEHGLDAVLEPVGRPVADEHKADDEHGCSRCGSSSSGCGSSSSGCGSNTTSTSSSCSQCVVKGLLANRRT